jgi:hypothetical protein
MKTAGQLNGARATGIGSPEKGIGGKVRHPSRSDGLTGQSVNGQKGAGVLFSGRLTDGRLTAGRLGPV